MADIFDNPMGLMGFEFIELLRRPLAYLSLYSRYWVSPKWPPTAPRMCTCIARVAST